MMVGVFLYCFIHFTQSSLFSENYLKIIFSEQLSTMTTATVSSKVKRLTVKQWARDVLMYNVIETKLEEITF